MKNSKGCVIIFKTFLMIVKNVKRHPQEVESKIIDQDVAKKIEEEICKKVAEALNIEDDN
jgi:hypothetical protein